MFEQLLIRGCLSCKKKNLNNVSLTEDLLTIRVVFIMPH